jgi:hypothetical protein
VIADLHDLLAPIEVLSAALVFVVRGRFPCNRSDDISGRSSFSLRLIEGTGKSYVKCSLHT